MIRDQGRWHGRYGSTRHWYALSPVAISSANNCLTLKHTNSGKSCFLSYVLFRLFRLEKNVAFQLDD